MNKHIQGWLNRIAVRVSQAFLTAFALVVIVFVIQAAQGQQRVINAIVAFFGVHTIYVDGNGSNATAVRGANWLPFKTLAAAKTTAASGDTIIVFPGTYTENDLLKNGVNWHFHNGANDTYTETNASGTGRGIFDDRNGAVTSTITGHGNFTYILTGTGSGNEMGLMYIMNSNSVVRFQAQDVSINVPNTAANTLLAIFSIVNCTYCNIDVDRAIDLNVASATGMCLWWIYGETYFHARQISKFGQWGIWSDETVLTFAPFLPPLTQALIPLATYNLWASWDDSASPNYISTESINITHWFDFKRVDTVGNIGFEIDCTGGKVYIRGEKVKAPTGIQMNSINGTNVTGLQVWADIQKLSASGQWMNLIGGTLTAEIRQFEDLGITVDGIAINSGALGDFRIRGQRMKMKTGSTAKPVDFLASAAGSKLLLEDLTIDAALSTQPPVTVVAAGVTLKNCVLVASAGVDSIKSAAAQNVAVYGTVMANTAKNANITITAGGTLTVNAAVQ